jgi:hypothetical protein
MNATKSRRRSEAPSPDVAVVKLIDALARAKAHDSHFAFDQTLRGREVLALRPAHLRRRHGVKDERRCPGPPGTAAAAVER